MEQSVRFYRLYHPRRSRLTQIVVDVSAGPYKDRTVMFLGSEDGRVMKVLASTHPNDSFGSKLLEDIDVYNPSRWDRSTSLWSHRSCPCSSPSPASCLHPGVTFRVRRTGGFWDWNWIKTITLCLWRLPAVSSECLSAAAPNTEPVKSKTPPPSQQSTPHHSVYWTELFPSAPLKNVFKIR